VQKREDQKTGSLIDELVAGNGIKAYAFWGVRGYNGGKVESMYNQI